MNWYPVNLFRSLVWENSELQSLHLIGFFPLWTDFICLIYRSPYEKNLQCRHYIWMASFLHELILYPCTDLVIEKNSFLHELIWYVWFWSSIKWIDFKNANFKVISPHCGWRSTQRCRRTLGATPLFWCGLRKLKRTALHHSQWGQGWFEVAFKLWQYQYVLRVLKTSIKNPKMGSKQSITSATKWWFFQINFLGTKNHQKNWTVSLLINSPII